VDRIILVHMSRDAERHYLRMPREYKNCPKSSRSLLAVGFVSGVVRCAACQRVCVLPAPVQAGEWVRIVNEA